MAKITLPDNTSYKQYHNYQMIDSDTIINTDNICKNTLDVQYHQLMYSDTVTVSCECESSQTEPNEYMHTINIRNSISYTENNRNVHNTLMGDTSHIVCTWNIDTNIWNVNNLHILNSTNPREPTRELWQPFINRENKENIEDPLISVLHETRANNAKNLIILHVNINSLKTGERDKNGAYDYIMDILNNRYADILCITETKLNNEYKDALYEHLYYKMHRKDKASNSGGMIVWVRSDIPQIRLHHREFSEDHKHHIESIVIDLKIRTQSWYLILLYKNPKVPNNVFLPKVKTLYDAATLEAQEVILLGDINIDMQYQNNNMTTDICNVYGLSNLITSPTCFKTQEGTLLDPVIVTNKSRFQNPINVHCGYSDYHNMVGCVTKLKIPPQEPQVIKYRSYKTFNEDKFREEVQTIPFSC